MSHFDDNDSETGGKPTDLQLEERLDKQIRDEIDVDYVSGGKLAEGEVAANGVYKRTYTGGNYGSKIHIVEEDGFDVHIFGSVDLDRKVEQLAIGDNVKIYLRKKIVREDGRKLFKWRIQKNQI